MAFGDETMPIEVDILSTPPTILCKWELPDMQPGTVAMEYPDPSIQYGTTDDPHQHDDDMATLPQPEFPCAGPPAAPPSMPDGVTYMMQVRPNPEDQPETRRIQLWAAVGHQNGIDTIDDVYWVVYQPDGTTQVEVHGTKVPSIASDCAALGSSTDTGSMFEAAYHSSQIAAAAIDDSSNGMVATCQQGESAIYYAKFPLSKHQPCGTYEIELHVVSDGAKAVLTNHIDVLCTYYMQVDFNGVNWGTLAPGVKDTVSGNLVFDGLDSPTTPTVKNVGNSGMGLGIQFSEMLQEGVDLAVAKKINQYEACFGKSLSTTQCIDPILASEVTWFDEDPERVLCSNEVGKLDLSIHPPDVLPGGRYAGTVEILARAVPICPGQ